MCRLFGLTAGRARVRATFWLLDAPDSLEVQGHRNVDGSGIGFFDFAGAPVLDKQPEPSFEDEEFIHEAKAAESTAFVAHVRRATEGELVHVWPDLSVQSAVVITQPPARLVPLPGQNPNIDT